MVELQNSTSLHGGKLLVQDHLIIIQFLDFPNLYKIDCNKHSYDIYISFRVVSIYSSRGPELSSTG